MLKIQDLHVAYGGIQALRGISLDELGQTILNIRDVSQTDQHFTSLSETQIKAFSKELLGVLNALQQIDPSQLGERPGSEIIHKIFDLSVKYLGADGCPFILGLLVSAIGEGSAFHELNAKISPANSKAIIRYLTQHPELYTTSLRDTSPVG